MVILLIIYILNVELEQVLASPCFSFVASRYDGLVSQKVWHNKDFGTMSPLK